MNAYKKKRDKSWIVLLVFFLGISAAVALLVIFARPDDTLADMERVDRGDYAAILWEGREYVPWSPGSGGRGEQIGYINGDQKDKVFAFRGMPVEAWIIDTHEDRPAILYREQSVVDIPTELGKSPYPWNQMK